MNTNEIVNVITKEAKESKIVDGMLNIDKIVNEIKENIKKSKG